VARKGGKDRGLFFEPSENGLGIGPKPDRLRGNWGVDCVDYLGRRQRKIIGPKSDAIAYRDKLRAEKLLYKRFPERFATPVRLAELIADHVVAKKGSGDKTAAVIERRLKLIFRILGNIEASDIPPALIEQLKLTLAAGVRKKKRKPATINRFLEDLNAALNRAREARKILRNPFDTVALLKQNNERTRELTDEEAKVLFGAIPANPPALRPYFDFLRETGARAGEVTSLTWPKILWRDRVGELPETKVGKKQYLVLSSKALAILKPLPRISDLVFCWPDGRPLTVDYATHVFHDAAEAAGIKDIRQHDLRHDFAIKRLRGGANIVAISGLLRHASRRSTDRYLHLTRDDLQRAVEAGSTGLRPEDGGKSESPGPAPEPPTSHPH
jgi:integrase